jgi:hypothetical protein
MLKYVRKPMTETVSLTKFERKILEYLFTYPNGATEHEIRKATNVHIATHAILYRFERLFWIKVSLSGEHRIFRISADGDKVMARILTQEKAK